MNSSNSEGLFAGALMGVLCVVGIIVILIIIANWKIFQKAGKPGWHSIIPILGTIDAYDICWSSGMGLVSLALGFILSILNRSQSSNQGMNIFKLILSVATLVINAVYLYKLAKVFGKGTGFFIGLLLLNPIFMLVLGFGDAVYQPNGPQSYTQGTEYQSSNSVYKDFDSGQNNSDNHYS